MGSDHSPQHASQHAQVNGSATPVTATAETPRHAPLGALPGLAHAHPSQQGAGTDIPPAVNTVSALRRYAAPAPAGPASARSLSPLDATIHRWPWGKKSVKNSDAGPVEKTAKKRFAEALGSDAPKDKGAAAERMRDLRALLGGMTGEERQGIATDAKLVKKAGKYVGDFEYMTLVTALGMAAKAPAKGKKKAAPTGPQHMSGAEADTFIQEHLGAIGHLKPFLDTAVAAGKKADGYVATVDQASWERIYAVQFPNEPIGSDDELTTNAFIANKHDDRPAIIHAERGTRSTAIHESMHRYSVLTILNTYGFRLNEGMTEYFTRRITDRDGNPVNGKPSNRDNYQGHWEFVGRLLSLLGATFPEQETTLAEIYFSGKVDLLKSRFDAACQTAKLDDKASGAAWRAFTKALSSGDWGTALGAIPPPAPKSKSSKESKKDSKKKHHTQGNKGAPDAPPGDAAPAQRVPAMAGDQGGT